MKNLAPLREELQALLARPKPERDRLLLEQITDRVLAEPRRLNPLPTLARVHSERVAERVRDPRGYRLDDDGKSKDRSSQWGQWYARITEVLAIDGVDLLRELLNAGDMQRFEMLAARVEAQVRALRGLELPWWPIHRIERMPYRELSLLDYVEQQLGKLNSASIRRGSGETRQPAPRRDVDDVDRDDWEPGGGLL